jgi:hypothetical protein
MKKIIDGKRYNTDTADVIASWHNGHHTNDFHYCSEDLYRTPKGAYFLHGEGGGLSKYATQQGNGSGWGATIIPMNADEARMWLEAHDCHEALEAEFPDTIQDA